MKIKTIVVVVAIALFIGAVLFVPADKQITKPPSGKGLTVGQKVPDFTLRDTNGLAWKLSDMSGSVVLLNFWASWCDSCKAEMPSLVRLHKLTKENPKFKIMTIIYKDNPDLAGAYLKKNKFQLPFLNDTDGMVSAAYGLTGVPETFIIDKNGILLNKIIGPAEFNSPEAIDFFLNLAKQ